MKTLKLKASAKRQRLKPVQQTDAYHIKLFWDAPLDALFGQDTIAVVVKRGPKTLECDRWRGQGIPFRKCSGRVLYKKADVISWIESHQLVNSTSEYEVPHA